MSGSRTTGSASRSIPTDERRVSVACASRTSPADWSALSTRSSGSWTTCRGSCGTWGRRRSRPTCPRGFAHSASVIPIRRSTPCRRDDPDGRADSGRRRRGAPDRDARGAPDRARDPAGGDSGPRMPRRASGPGPRKGSRHAGAVAAGNGSPTSTTRHSPGRRRSERPPGSFSPVAPPCRRPGAGAATGHSCAPAGTRPCDSGFPGSPCRRSTAPRHRPCGGSASSRSPRFTRSSRRAGAEPG